MILQNEMKNSIIGINIFYSTVQLEYYVMLLFTLLNTNYFINDGEEVEQVCTNQECKACLYTVNFVTSHQVK